VFKADGQHLIAACLNLALPGMGYSILGKLVYAVMAQTALFIIISIFCLTEWIYNQNGIITLIALVCCIHISTGIHAFIIDETDTNKKFTSAVFFILITLVILIYKTNRNDFFGLEVFYVPSMSMYPTIKPGQFILANSNAYIHRFPNTGDIIVFTQNKNTLIKRVASIPEKQDTDSNGIYVLGDYSVASIDSRQFGLIEHQQVLAQARLTLLTFDPSYNIQLEFTPLK